METNDLNIDTAEREGARLAALPHYPVGNAAVAADVMRTLKGLCTGGRKYHGKLISPDEQCSILVGEIIDRCDRWGGLVQIKDVFYDLFPNYPTFDAKGRID